jgi:hypothetical protein
VHYYVLVVCIVGCMMVCIVGCMMVCIVVVHCRRVTEHNIVSHVTNGCARPCHVTGIIKTPLKSHSS